MSKNGWRRAVAILVALVAVVAAGWWALRIRPVSLDVATVVDTVPVRVFGLGTVEARVASKVGFEVGAALVELTSDHGDRVMKGAVLARLHASEQEAKVARAKAGLLGAEVALSKSEAAVRKAGAVLAQKQDANRRKQSLVDRHVVSEQSAEEALRDEEVAKAELEVAKAEVEVARAQIVDGKAQLDFETTVFNHHVLRAPYDALVVARHAELGTVVKAGDPIFTLIAPETVWAMAHVDEARAGGIEEGQPVEVRLRSLPHSTFEGRVARIGIESDRVTEERRIYIRCVKCPPRFFLGEQAEVLVKVGELKNALMVPEAAVRSFDGRTALAYTIENGRLAERRVDIGQRTEDSRLQVIGGLPEGAMIALGVPADARLGRAVRARRGSATSGSGPK